jgi:hypothetical protein
VHGHAHHPGGRLDGQVEAALPAARPVLSERRDRAVDQRGLARTEPVPAQPEALHHAGSAVLDEDVGLEHERARRVAGRRVLEVERDRALAAIDRREVLGVAVRDRWPLPHRVALGRLDLDDLGAEVGEQHAAERPGRHLAELDDAHALERAKGGGRHAPSCFMPIERSRSP